VKIVLYNHQFLTEDYYWVSIYIDQLKQLEDFGLYDEVDSIRVTALGSEEQINLLNKLSGTYSKIKVYPIINTSTTNDIANDFAKRDEALEKKFIYETPTIKRIWEDSKTDNFLALYFHSKGASSLVRHFKNGDVDTFKNYFYWRKYLEWGCLEKWRECVTALKEGHQLAGCNYNGHPFPHFSGNFWWCRSDYIKTLDDVSNSDWWKSVKQPYFVDRLVDEFWVGHKADKIFVLDSPPDNLCSPNPGLYSEPYLRKYYDRLQI
jgi:hypothetical protein